MIFMLAPAPNMVFGGMPSGTTYAANQYGLIYVVNGSVPDQIFLQDAGCATLVPFGNYQLPPLSKWGLAATGCSNFTTYSGTNSAKVMTCRVHFATAALGGTIKLTLGNWVNTENVGDYWGDGAANMGPITVNGSICYPGPNNIIGAYGPVTIAPGANLDVLVPISVEVPAGAKFYEGVYVVPTSGCQIPIIDAVVDPSNILICNLPIGEGSILSTSATDLTGSLATISGIDSAVMYGALAISAVQPITQPVLAVDADSLEAGFRGGADAFNNVGPFAWAFGDSVAVLNLGCSGKTAAADVGGGASGTGYTSAMQMREDTMRRCGVNIVLVALGTNDFNGGAAAPTIMADLSYKYTEYDGLGFQVWGATLPPRTTSTDSWATTTNQSVTANESKRTGLNTLLRAKPTPLAGVLEFCTPVESSPGSGLWMPNWTFEGVHWNKPATLAASGMVPVTSFNAAVPAQVIAYADTWGRNLHSTQAALDFLLDPADPLGAEVRVGSALINFNSTSDQAIALSGPPNFVISRIVVRNPTLTFLSTAAGAFYSAASKTGPLMGTATTTSFTDVTSAGGAHVFNGGASVRNPTQIFASLTTPQGATAAATVDVYGVASSN
jgi:hypothetical protein